MAEIRVARDYFLWSLSAIYLFAFGSLYYQIPGLFGDKGLLPVHLILRKDNKTLEQCFAERPTILCWASDLGLDPQSMMEILAIAGTVISFIALTTHRYRTTITFGLLWATYFSLYQVGQTFLWFQWDILLLETGFLAIIVAPLNLFTKQLNRCHHHDAINMWLIRWLLFRFMFASGVVKLTSQCPTWWGLTALQYHFESQCIPTPLAWFAHHLPKWVLKLGVVATFLIEIPIPFLFFAPLKGMILFSFACQVLFQLFIILTGNYNFFNLLTITLCLSLLDDNYYGVFYEYQLEESRWERFAIIRMFVGLVRKVFEWIVFFGLLYWATALFSLQVQPNFTIESKIAFSYQQFNRTLAKALTWSIWMGVISLSFIILRAMYRSLAREQGFKRKMQNFFSCLFFGCVAFGLFGISTIPHTSVHDETNARIWPVLHKWHNNLDRYHLVNSYGLFRRMTGVGGRPEIIVEGSHHVDGGWQEYEFLYKPGRVEMSPPVCVPYQPRLDWQMWFAALGKYNHNPWFVHMLYRLLHNQRDIVKLLQHNPFVKTPPKFIRANIYTFHYTAWELKKRNKNHPRNWWKRKKLGTYFPPMSKDNVTLVQYLKNVNLWENKPTGPKIKPRWLRISLRYFRRFACSVSGSSFLWSMFFAAIIIKQLIGSDVIPIKNPDSITIVPNEDPHPKSLKPPFKPAVKEAPKENNKAIDKAENKKESPKKGKENDFPVKETRKKEGKKDKKESNKEK